MKANESYIRAVEFIKKYGLDHAKLLVENMEAVQIGNNSQNYIDELKRLVESHELVYNLGGLEEAKNYLSLSNVRINGLKQAISNVESCL